MSVSKVDWRLDCILIARKNRMIRPKKRDPFLPVGAKLYRERRGILVLRDCIVGHIPRYLWPRMIGRKLLRSRSKLRHDFFD